MIEQGAEEIGNPWPSADLPIVSGPIWNLYSDEQLLERTKAIYSSALRIYSFIVEKWLLDSPTRLHLYRTLPVRLEGWLTPSALKTPREGGWPLDWYFRILPADRHSEVSIELRPGIATYPMMNFSTTMISINKKHSLSMPTVLACRANSV